MSTELDLGGIQFSIGKMTPMKQLHVGRRLAPAVLAMMASAASLEEGKVALSNALALGAMGPLAQAISDLPDDKFEFVCTNCLAVVQRKQAEKERWVPVATKEGRPLFDDIDAPMIIKLVVAVVKDNLGNFMDALSDGSAGPASPAQ